MRFYLDGEIDCIVVFSVDMKMISTCVYAYRFAEFPGQVLLPLIDTVALRMICIVFYNIK